MYEYVHMYILTGKNFHRNTLPFSVADFLNPDEREILIGSEKGFNQFSQKFCVCVRVN